MFPIHASDTPATMKDSAAGPGLAPNDPMYSQMYPNVRKHFVEEGMYLNRHYTASVCSPSRKQLLSGRSIWSQGNGDWLPVRPRYSMISDKLKQAGYTNHFVGKWHLGDISRRSWPKNRGFDTSRGFHFSGIGDSYEWKLAHNGIEQTCGVDASYDLIYEDIMPDGGAEHATYAVNDRAEANKWPGKTYIHNGEDNRPANLYEQMFDLYTSRESGDAAADATLNTYFADSENTNHATKTIREETVRHIESKDGTSPFFIYVAATAMRGFGEQTDTQRQTVYDLEADNIRNCNIHDPDLQPSPSNTGLNALRTAIEADGQNWNEVIRGYLHEFCPSNGIQAETHAGVPTNVPSGRKNDRFITHAFATNIDLIVNKTVDALYRTNLWENTLLLLTFDNGGWPNAQNFNWPLRGGKQTYLEGGNRMHTALSGGYLPTGLHGTVSNVLSSNVDFWPTFSWMAGLDPYYDPKEDMAAYGGADAGNGKKFAPNSVDGVNLVHSWNKVSLARAGK